MDEELDYMSEEFIKKCEESASDFRPGLIKTHKELRQHNLMKKKNSELENKKKTTEILQAEVREESLKQPLNAGNKGFLMLEKMGFKSGMGLGKNNSGIKEPLGLNIRKDKIGLGHKTSYRTKTVKIKESKLDQVNEDDYRAFMSKKNKQREILSDFRKSQRICKELDLKCDKIVPEESWFWPPEKSESEKDLSDEIDDGDNEDKAELDLSDSEKLEIITQYLRDNYFYCVWCKLQYNDEKDLKDCPGSTRDDH